MAIDPISGTVSTVLSVVGNIVGHNSASKAQQKLEKAFEQAIENNFNAVQTASEIIQTGYETALRYNSQGMTDAANAITSYTNKAVQVLFDQTNVAADIRKRFMVSADQQLNKALKEGTQYLEPYWNAGVDALDEMQAMLGIGDNTFDPTKITQTPGYQFILDQGLESVDKSAVGTKLSGAQAEAITEFSQGHAEQYYQTFMKDLDNIASKGLTAAQGLTDLTGKVYTAKAQLRYDTGNALGNDAFNTGVNVAKTLSGAGSQLATTYQTGNTNQANLTTSYYNNEGQLRLKEADNLNNLLLGQASSEAQFGANEGNYISNVGTDLAKAYGQVPTTGSGSSTWVNPDTGLKYAGESTYGT